ncbi:MAG: pyridoxamine 5'-phosphate oxidase family protein [Proteobacteria bacterium]|nr:pyridoxamine 5'-phosphate oxidase family protein [Pseudomonadota bacterium]
MNSRLKTLLVISLLVPAPLAAADDAEVLALARETIKAARYAALVTVDEQGQPRARTVDPFLPDDNFVVWVATRPVTRKVSQIRANPGVTLYYFDPASRSYVTLMGQARLIEDLATRQAMRREADSDRFYPDFPEDYLLIRIEPDYLEAIVPGYRGDPESWAPARVEFTRSSPSRSGLSPGADSSP